MAAGMNVALLNLSFGTREEHIETIKMLRLASKNFSINMGRNYPLAIAARLPGRKIRTGRIADVCFGNRVTPFISRTRGVTCLVIVSLNSA